MRAAGRAEGAQRDVQKLADGFSILYTPDQRAQITVRALARRHDRRARRDPPAPGPVRPGFHRLEIALAGCATGFRPEDRRELRSRRVRGHAVARVSGWLSYRFIHCDLLTRRVPACRVERASSASAAGPKASLGRGNSRPKASFLRFDTTYQYHPPFRGKCRFQNVNL